MKYLLPALLLVLCSCDLHKSGSAIGTLVHIEERSSPGICTVYTSVTLQTAQSGRTQFIFTDISRSTFDAFEGKTVEIRYQTTIPLFGCDKNVITVRKLN